MIGSVLEYCNDVIVVNDGSTDSTGRLLTSLGDKIHVVSYQENRGKGYALTVGFKKALDLGFSNVITIDSDGQHFASDIPKFVELAEANPNALIIGSRGMGHSNMPDGNKFANRLSNFWFAAQTGISLPDTQTGFRLYPLAKMRRLRPTTYRYEAELELLVRSAWRGIRIIPVPIDVYYPPQSQRVSHFKPAKDFIRISLLNTILCIVAIVYGYPRMAISRLMGRRG